MPELFVVNGICGGTVFYLPEVPTVVGRSAECQVQIGDPWISSMHALFERRGEELWLLDLDSRNGTFVDEQRVKEAQVGLGTRLRFGKTSAEIRESRSASAGSEEILSEQGTVIRYLSDLREDLSQLRGDGGRRDTAPGARAGQTGPIAVVRRQLAVLNEIGRALVDASGLDECLKRVLQIAGDAVEAERSSLLLMDESGKMVPRVHNPSEGPPLGSEALMAAAARTRAGILSLDAQQDLRFASSQSIISQGIRSCLCVPIWADNRILGMILLDRGLGDPFTAEDLELVALVGYQAAIAIDRERFAERARASDRRSGELLRHFPSNLVHAALTQESLDRNPLDLALRPEAAVLRAEIDGLLALAEIGSMDQVEVFLHECFEGLQAVVFDYGGVLERRAGSSLTALFGVPGGEPESAIHALRCGLAMQQRFGVLRQVDAPLVPMALRIGVESGRVLAGNYGPSDRPDFAAFGEAVDAAVALASAAGPGEVAAGPNARERAGGELAFQPVVPRPVDRTEVGAWRVSGKG